jgi:hypothetical protein
MYKTTTKKHMYKIIKVIIFVLYGTGYHKLKLSLSSLQHPKNSSIWNEIVKGGVKYLAYRDVRLPYQICPVSFYS